MNMASTKTASMKTAGATARRRGPRLFGFTRRHLLPRLDDTIFHRNVVISLVVGGVMTFVSFRLGWFPALKKAAVKDFVAGVLAFSALGFGAATAAAVLALSMPRSRLYFTMIVNGKGAPLAKVIRMDGKDDVLAVEGELWERAKYGPKFRSLYGDLIFIFLWTMAAQLFMGAVSLLYFGLAGDLNMVDCTQCRRSSIGLFVMVTAVTYAILQLGSLLKAMADYAVHQEHYDRMSLISAGELEPPQDHRDAPD
jgi:hypothetical protein